MALEIFPSATMTRYIGRTFAVRVVSVLFMLVLVLQVLDLLGESGEILAGRGNGQAQLWVYVGLRLPQLLAKFLPYSVLLATIITLSSLNHNSEVIAMKAAGLSAHQILAPLFLVAGVLAVGNFILDETVVDQASARLKAWQAVHYDPIPPADVIKTNIWLQDGANILFARTITGEGAAMQLSDVSWYRRDANGVVTDIVHSPSARFAGPGWRFAGPVTSFNVAQVHLSTIPGAPIYAPGVAPAQVVISHTDPDGETLFRLSRSITTIHAAGYRTDDLDSKWWHKISGPLAGMLMPLLGAVAAFGLARSGQLVARAAIGMALGFAYFVVENMALAVGNFGGYPPLLAAWSPFVLFLLIGETVLIRTEE